jgi:hypothetical protein
MENLLFRESDHVNNFLELKILFTNAFEGKMVPLDLSFDSTLPKSKDEINLLIEIESNEMELMIRYNNKKGASTEQRNKGIFQDFYGFF